MAYIINRYDGTQLVTVEDGTVDQSTNIKLIGKNYNGYGEAQNENMLHMMEHFAGTSAPTKAISGQVWYDAGTAKLKFYTGGAWKNAGGAEVAATEPAGLAEGDLWYSTTANQLYAKTASGEFILVGPQAAGDGTTQMLSLTVVDSTSTNRSLIVGLINDEPVYAISNLAFTLNSSQPASVPTSINSTNFPLIKAGLTLVGTNTSGVSSSGASSSPIFWGTASDALSIAGVDTDAIIKINGAREIIMNESADGGATVVAARLNDNGLTVGNSNDLQLKVVSGTIGYLGNTQGNEIQFAAARTPGTATTIASVKNVDATNAGIIPSTNSLYNLGTSSLKWATVHADTFSGVATEAGLLTVSGTGRSATTGATANTIAARDSSGNLTAVVFNGTATKARYADLAEKYTTGEELAPGTAVAVCSHLDHEVEPASASSFCIGVVSTDPAIMMNSEAEGQYIALKGRVPVRVKGAVKKGQAVYAMADGVSTTIATSALVGLALESNDSEDEKLVECVLKV